MTNGREPANLASDRLARLLDPDSAHPLAGSGDDGFRAVTGTVHGCPVAAFAADPAVSGGAMGVAGCAVVGAAYEHALAAGCPVIGLWHSGSTRAWRVWRRSAGCSRR